MTKTPQLDHEGNELPPGLYVVAKLEPVALDGRAASGRMEHVTLWTIHGDPRRQDRDLLVDTFTIARGEERRTVSVVMQERPAADVVRQVVEAEIDAAEPTRYVAIPSRA